MARTTLLTHTLTHTGKGAVGINGHDSAAYHCLMEQIGPEKTKKQTMNGSQSVGKDEVGSSNLPSSSKRNPRATTVLGFFLFLEVQQPPEKTRQKPRRGQKTKPDRSTLPGFFHVCFECVPENLTGPLDALLVGVGVHPQRDRLVTVAQLLRHAGNVGPAGDCDAGEGVP